MSTLERIFQDDHFIVSELDGCNIEALICCEVPETKEVAIIYLKVENHLWCSFFLDVGFGVWSHCGEIEEDDSYTYRNFMQEHDLAHKTITHIRCEPLQNHAQIIIELKDHERVVLRPKDPQDYDSACELVKLDKVWSIFDYWDMTILSGIAQYGDKRVYFENSFDAQEANFSEEYFLTELTPDIFDKALENWAYWLDWLKKHSIEHPVEYAKKRKLQSYASLVGKYDQTALENAEKYYQNELLIQHFIHQQTDKLRLKGIFEGDIRGIDATFVQWQRL